MNLPRITASLILSVLLCLHVVAGAVEEGGRWPSSVPADTASLDAGGLSSLKRFFGGFGSQPDLLPLEQAFTAEVRVRDANSLVVTFEPVKGYYFYRDRISFRIEEPADIKITTVFLPDGKMKADPTFGEVAVFYSRFEAVVRLQRTNPAASNGRLRFGYQGCSELGVCYPPIDKTFDFVLPVMGDASTGSPVALPADRQASTLRLG